MKPTRRSAGDPSRLNRVAARRSPRRCAPLTRVRLFTARFIGRSKPGPVHPGHVLPVGAPPSPALSAGSAHALVSRVPHRPVLPVGASALTWVSPQAVTACRAGNARERRPRRSAGMERRSSGPHRENWPAPRPKAAKRVQLPSVKRASQNKAPPLQRGIPIRRLRQSVESSGSSVEFHPPQRGVPANRPPQAPDISSVSCFCKLRSFTHAPQGPFPPKNTPNSVSTNAREFLTLGALADHPGAGRYPFRR